MHHNGHSPGRMRWWRSELPPTGVTSAPPYARADVTRPLAYAPAVVRGAGGVLMIVLVAFLVACDSGGSPSSTASEPSGGATLEVRPVTALLPPGDPTVPADADT